MYPGFSVPSSRPFLERNKQNEEHIIPNQSLAADGFNIWWQKAFAQYTATASEASALMRAHRRVHSASQARVEHPQ
jgi:hypothetical protein